MWINCKTEFTFKKVYGHIDQVAERCAQFADYGGMADLNNTFGHIRWRTACKKAGIKPIYGVQLPVVEDLDLKERRYAFNSMTFIAMNQAGIQELYKLVDMAHLQFYYRPRLSYAQINEISENITVLGGVAPRWDLITRIVFHELGPHIPYSQRTRDKPAVACIDNFYPIPEDKIIYEPFSDQRLRERKMVPMHILSRTEWLVEFPGREDALENLDRIAKDANVDLPNAPMVKYVGKDDINQWCLKGAKNHNIDIVNPGKYHDRYLREMELIRDKGYVDYFLVTADLIRYAKTRMSVGPARGSSAGSLVCYLMGITEIDPLEYGLYFERFIDVNRFDLPDIDIDFQDDKRHLVLNYLKRKYGRDNVAQIGNISRMKPKSAISRFAQSLNIPIDDVNEVKDAIMERSGGDARAASCMEDTFEGSDVGKAFIERYPSMLPVAKIESHASHTGVHAAGILVCNDPITKYCGINSRDKKRIAMLDKKDAEKINLLKIDALGLRTLSILASVCDQIGKPYTWLYDIPVDDDAAYRVFNEGRFNGIFQFEGPAIKGLAKQMPIENMEDIAALGALGRPGPLSSGGANRFIKYRVGKEAVEYLSDHPAVVAATESTFGIVIYQEQMLTISREYGKLSWADTSDLRRAASKSLGDEFFGKYKEKFIAGALENGESIESAENVWSGINTMGSWAFNKSHAVSYGLVSYLCAYMKGNYPMEFTIAALNHAKDDRSALKILRDMVENDGIEYVHFDPEISQQGWTEHKGILYGGLTTISGIAQKTANKVVKLREEGKSYPKGIAKSMAVADTYFKYLYPGRELYGDYYTNPKSHGINRPVSLIQDAQEDGQFVIIGCLIKKNLRDANEACFVTKRDGKYLVGSTTWLNITLEDDTDSMMCKISIKDYQRLGQEIAETGKEDKDWYMVYGEKINGWGIMFVKNIRKITRR